MLDMKRYLLRFLLLCLPLQALAAPDAYTPSVHFGPKSKKKTSAIDKTRLLFGPGLGFGAAQRSFSINLSPSVAYCFTDHFHAGTTLGFNYFQQAFDYQNILYGNTETYRYKVPAYSWSVYARYLIGNFLILNVEPELNNTKFIRYPFQYPDDFNLSTGKIQERSTRLMIPSVLVGGGYAQRFGRYGYTYLMVCYDLVQNPNARYYQTLDYRFGVMLSLW